MFYIALGQGLCLGSSHGAKAQAAVILPTARPQQKQKETEKKLLRHTIHQHVAPRAHRLNRPRAPIYFLLSLQLHIPETTADALKVELPITKSPACSWRRRDGSSELPHRAARARMSGRKQQRRNKPQKQRGNSQETAAWWQPEREHRRRPRHRPSTVATDCALIPATSHVTRCTRHISQTTIYKACHHAPNPAPGA